MREKGREEWIEHKRKGRAAKLSEEKFKEMKSKEGKKKEENDGKGNK